MNKLEQNNYDKFMNLFNECEGILKKKVKNRNQEFAALLRDGRRTDRIIRRYYDDINNYRELRNALVHGRTKAKLAEPYSHIVEGFEKIVEALKNPPRARGIMTAPVVSFQLDDSIAAAANEMREKQLTNVPVYDDESLIGILSEQSFVEWIAVNYKDDGLIASELSLKEISQFLHSPTGTSYEKYHFASPETDAFTIQDIFTSEINNGNRLNAVFVTHDGKPKNKILGIISAWDLPRAKVADSE